MSEQSRVGLTAFQFIPPLYQPVIPGGPDYRELKAFKHPFIPIGNAGDANVPNIISSLAAWTISSVFNMGMCNHLSGQPSRINLAIKQYKEAWYFARQCEDIPSESLLVLFGYSHIHESVRLLFESWTIRPSLGQLDEAYHWLCFVRILVGGCVEYPNDTTRLPLFNVFRVAASVLTRHVAAGAV
mmetsp:Transcript_21974/g.28458  ORF Transcript_21974/g.28458 Transcript_21974/m.28458 type:complete len:185 (+) Transcript_21974:178-732(+)